MIKFEKMSKKFTTEFKIRLIDISDKRIIPFLLIFIFFFLISSLFEVIFAEYDSFRIVSFELPAFQTTQAMIVFPIIILASYLIFIRRKVFTWADIGFSKGNEGIWKTIQFGIFGGLIVAIFNFFTIKHFIIKERIVYNLIEKCIFAPIWEEFIIRVILLTVSEFFIVTVLKFYFFDNPRYKISDKSKKWITIELYLLLVVLNAFTFVLFHGITSSMWIFFSGAVMAIVYLKTRSLIAPVIVHSMHNFITGGFLFLIIQWISG